MTQLAGDDSFIEEKKMADSGETLVFFGIIITFILRKFISFSRKLCACHIDYMRIIWSINGLEIHTMTKVSTNISLDANLKKKSQELYANLGMDLTTTITIFLRQSLLVQNLPFSVTRENPNIETIAAINEYYEMKAHPEKYKKYSSFCEAMDQILNDT